MASVNLNRTASFGELPELVQPPIAAAQPVEATHQEGKTPFRRIFESVRLRKEFEGFLDNVFMQLDKTKLYALLDDIMKDKSLSDDQIYMAAYLRIDEARPTGLQKIKQQLKSLSRLRQVMMGQAKEIVDQLKSIFPNKLKVNGIMEIGYPGRHLKGAKQLFDVTGPAYAMEDAENVTDFIQQRSFFKKPYDRMIHLGNYEGISDEVKDQSLDMVYCFTGLHHADPQHLDKFVDDLFKKIRPGGHFVLRDHDCIKFDEKGDETGLRSMAVVVHRVFNLGTGVTPNENRREIHNFQSMDYWKSVLAKHGFRCITEGKGLVQEGDPSMNTLVAFERLPVNEDEDLIAARRVANNNPGYVRNISDSAISANEWHIVDIAKEYKNFMAGWDKGEKTFDQFPFWTQIGVLWRLYVDSCKAIRKNHGVKALLTNVGTYMNGAFVVMLTIDSIFKSIVWTPVWLLGSKKVKQEAKTVEALANYAKNYGDFLDTRYFHEYSYFGEIKNLWKATKEDGFGRNIFLNLYLATTVSIGLAAKGMFCGLINAGYGDAGNQTLDMIVKGDIPAAENVTTKVAYGNTKVVSFPRYKPGTNYLIELAKSGAEIVEIAGQREIYIKTLVKPGTADLAGVEGCKKAFEKPIIGEENRYVTYKVELSKLGSVIEAFEANEIEVNYIHDY